VVFIATYNWFWGYEKQEEIIFLASIRLMFQQFVKAVTAFDTGV